MKYPKITITIPEPCHEDWNQMTPTEKGRFCKACTRELIDFSSKSDEEVINHVMRNDKLCGRFHPSQLDRTLIADRKKRNHWISYAASLLFPFALFSQEAKSTAKKTPKIEQDTSQKYTSLKIGSLHKNKREIKDDNITISGTITNELELPLVGVSIIAKGANKGVTTDFDGKYSITVRYGSIIVINHADFSTKEIRVDKKRDAIYNVTMKWDEYTELSGVAGYITCTETPGADAYGYISAYDKKSYPKPMTTEEVKANKKRVKNYFAMQKKKWRERREKRRQARAKRRAERRALKN